MPHISLFNESQFVIRPNERSNHLKKQSITFGQLNESGHYANVKIFAKCSGLLTSNCAVISSASKLLQDVFDCQCSGCEYTIICPDFELEALTKSLELLHTGNSTIGRQNLKSVHEIVDCLKIKSLSDQIATIISGSTEDGSSEVPDEDHRRTVAQIDEVVEVEDDERSLIHVEDNEETTNPNDVREQNVTTTESVADKSNVNSGMKKKNANFSCKVCRKVFNLKFSLSQHLKKEHGKASKDKINLKPSVILSRTDQNSFKCHKCDSLFVRRPKLLLHAAQFHYRDEVKAYFGVEKMECGICNRVMSNNRMLIGHLVNTHGVIDKYMPKGLKSYSRAVAEKNKKSPRIVDEEQPIGASQKKIFGCKICPATRFEYRELVIHYCLVHYKTDLFTTYKIDASNSCSYPECGMKYTRQPNLLFHLVTSHGALTGKIPSKNESRPEVNKSPSTSVAKVIRKCYKCNICHQTRGNYEKILQHFTLSHFEQELINRHNINDDNLKCSFCEVQMSTISTLILHMVCSHEALKEDIPSKEALEVEEEAPKISKAAKEYPLVDSFECHICQETRPSYDKLLSHYGNVHYRQKLAHLYTMNEGRFQCMQCNKQLTKFYNVIQHLVFLHKALGKWIPEKTSLMVRRRLAKDRSPKRSTKSQKRFTCKYCKKRCLGKTKLQSHKQTCKKRAELKCQTNPGASETENRVKTGASTNGAKTDSSTSTSTTERNSEQAESMPDETLEDETLETSESGDAGRRPDETLVIQDIITTNHYFKSGEYDDDDGEQDSPSNKSIFEAHMTPLDDGSSDDDGRM